MNRYRIGLDIGSTTAKIVAINNRNEIVFSKYERHQTNIIPVIIKFLEQLKAQAGSCALNIKITGSVGMPFTNIFTDAKNGSEIINLAAQFGEGWLLPGEVVTFAKQGINNVISLQPFGCIANHIVAKGMEKKIKTLYPQMNLLSLDFDSGVSDVNVANRLLLFIDNIKKV